MDHDEAAAVLAHRKDAPAAGLVALAEGWPAVIGLAALTDELDLPEGSLPDALYEYFAEELYQAAAPAVQDGILPSRACSVAWRKALPSSCSAKTLRGHPQGRRFGSGFFRHSGGHGSNCTRCFGRSSSRKAREHRSTDRAEAKRLALPPGTSREPGTTHYYWSNSTSRSALFVDILELGLPTMLAEARTRDARNSGLDLADGEKVDAPIVDLAEAEIAFHTS